MRFVFAFIFQFCLSFNALAQVQEIFEVTSDVYVRAGIGTSYEIVGVVKAGEEVVALDKSNSTWFKVESTSGTGYISTKFLKFKEERIPFADTQNDTSNVDEAETVGGGFGIGALFFVVTLIALFFVLENSRKKKKASKILHELAKRQNPKPRNTLVTDSVERLLSANISKSTSIPTEKLNSQKRVDLHSDSNVDITTLKKGSVERNLNLNVPFWADRYISSTSALDAATTDQKFFYQHFKKKFLEGVCLDLKGNTNYAFILIYDFLKEFESYGDKEKLENRLTKIAAIYPKVRSYAIGVLANSKVIEKTQNLDESNDDSILDITNEITVPLYNGTNLGDSSSWVPDWPHKYIYSKSDLNSATEEQKAFYQRFRNKFLEGVSLDISGNTNYAFILLFDLLEDYKEHKNISKLELELNRLGNVYYKTRQYGIKFLNEIKRKEGLIPQIPEVRIRITSDSPAGTQTGYDTYPEYVYWKLGSKYKEKLGLDDTEVDLLNKLWESTNNFTGIEFCYLQVMRLYLNVIREFKEICVQEGTTAEEVFLIISDLVARFQFKYRKGSSNYNMSLRNTSDLLYSQIFKRCENEVREHYGHKRKLSTDSLFSDPRIMIELESKILKPISILLSDQIKSIPAPDEVTQIELNSLNSNRWKPEFEEICEKFENESEKFINSIIALGDLNRKNQSVENIFYEASKFIAPKHSEHALILYLHYLYHDLKSVRFDNKPLTKTIQKSIFKSPEQVEQFELIVEEFLKDKNLEKGTKAISSIFAIKRKKITLNKLSIEDVKQKHAGTVDLLNEYLQDEDSLEELSLNTTLESETKELSFTINQEPQGISSFVQEIPFKPIHFQVLEFFVKNNLTVAIPDFEEFAKNQGAFKNQIIDSINEACFEILDDILIEEDDEFYTIESAYFQTISAK